MRPRLLIITLLFSMISNAFALECRLSLEEAKQNLIMAQRLEAMHVGYAAKISPLYCSYQVLEREDNAEIWDDIFANASDAGKLYSLAWYYNHDKERYNDKKSELNMTGEILILNGCVGIRRSKKEFIALLERQKLISLLGWPLPKWMKRKEIILPPSEILELFGSQNRPQENTTSEAHVT